jgi:hypothetical protein
MDQTGTLGSSEFPGTFQSILSGNACYHLVPKLWSCHLLSKDSDIKIYKTIILLFIMYALSSALNKEHI